MTQWKAAEQPQKRRHKLLGNTKEHFNIFSHYGNANQPTTQCNPYMTGCLLSTHTHRVTSGSKEIESASFRKSLTKVGWTGREIFSQMLYL